MFSLLRTSRTGIIKVAASSAVVIATQSWSECTRCDKDAATMDAGSGSRTGQWIDNWDMRQAATPPTVPATSTGEKPDESTAKSKKKRVCHQIVLIRHGEYESGKDDHLRVLTDRGRRQASLAGSRLQEMVDSKAIYPVKYVFYSTMARATETHGLIQPHLKGVLPHHVEPCSMIREGAVCRPQPPHPTWKPSDEDFYKDGLRIEAAFAAHIHRADDEEEDEDYTTVLVCHGNVIRYFALKALQLPVDAWLRTSVANCSISTLHIGPSGKVSLRGLGDVGHLAPKDITW